MDEPRPKITHVAILFRGIVYSLPPPNRHHHIIRLIVDQTGVKTVDGDTQGFIDDSGKFLTREDALVSALENNQVKDINDIRAGKLFSEDLW